MRYEPKHARPISTRRFLVRLASHGGIVVILMAVSLAVGMIGYQHYERMAWRDAFLNASMLLAGEGPGQPAQGQQQGWLSTGAGTRLRRVTHSPAL